jgi:predicted MPP superfamily phosphohydrolase
MWEIAWMTDIHLNFLKRSEVVAFCRNVAEMNPDAVLLGGDIGDARTIKTYLEIFQDVLGCPIYFLLGNHDFYHGSIAEVREQAKTLSADSRLLHWLPHFSCKAAGDVISKHMYNYPDRKILVLCGHTHDAFQIRIRPNVEIRVGGAVYGAPCIQELLRLKLW